MEDKKLKASAIMDAMGDLPDDLIDEAAKLETAPPKKKDKIIPISLVSGLAAVAVFALVINMNKGVLLDGNDKSAYSNEMSTAMDQDGITESGAACVVAPYSTATGEIAEISGEEITIKVISDDDIIYDSDGEGYPEQVYTVSDPALLEGFEPGDQICYSYSEEDEVFIIHDIEIVTNED